MWPSLWLVDYPLRLLFCPTIKANEFLVLLLALHYNQIIINIWSKRRNLDIKSLERNKVALNHKEDHLAAMEHDESKDGLSSTITTKTKTDQNTKKETKLKIDRARDVYWEWNYHTTSQ